MDAKVLHNRYHFLAVFFACLTDAQLGFSYAHEYNSELSDLLQDELNVKQYQLFEKWNQYKKTISTENDGNQSLLLKELTDKMNKMMEMFTARMDNIETKMENNYKKLEHTFSEKFAGMEQLIKNSGEEMSKEPPKAVSEPIIKDHDWKSLNEKVDDILINTSASYCATMNEAIAISWLSETQKAVYKQKKDYIRPSIVNTVFGTIIKFENNNDIEERGCSLLPSMTKYSDSTVHYICNNPGAVQHLMELIEKVMKKFPNNRHSVFSVFLDMADCKKTQKMLLKFEYLTIFLNQLAVNPLLNSGLESSLIIAKLLDLPENDFPHELTKEMVDNNAALMASWVGIDSGVGVIYFGMGDCCMDEIFISRIINSLLNMDEFKLKTEPAERIVFSGEKLGDEYVVTNLNITNPTNGRVAYKVKCTSNDMFRICSPVGVIKAGCSDIVMLQFAAGRGIPESGRHYFVIQYIKAEDETKRPRTCWEEHKGKPEETKKMFVDFEKEEDKLNVIYKDMLTALIESSVVPAVPEENDEETEDIN